MIRLETFMVLWYWFSAVLNLLGALYYSTDARSQVCTETKAKAGSCALWVFIDMLFLMWMKSAGWW